MRFDEGSFQRFGGREGHYTSHDSIVFTTVLSGPHLSNKTMKQTRLDIGTGGRKQKETFEEVAKI